MLPLAVFVALFYSSTALCPTGFELVRNGECYREVSEAQLIGIPDAPSIAKTECKEYNALPVIIRNQEDHDYWVSVSRSNRVKGITYGNVLLGLECNFRSRWQWSDGSKITFKPDGYNHVCGFEGNHHDVDLYCVVIPPINRVEPDSDCANFSYDGNDDVCYQVGITASNWTEANTICRSFGANVASIHNERENTFIRRLAVSKGLVNNLMLGATWNKTDKEWSDGTKWDYENFAPGFPVEGSGECLAMQTNNVNGQWINVDCSSISPFACMRQKNADQPGCGSSYKEGDTIYSPGFPSNSSQPCVFTLSVDEGRIVEVEILLLEANECCDRLELYEGATGNKIIANLSGDSHNNQKYRTTSSNLMRASWNPQGGVNVRGMMITFRSLAK